jgi:hypothetical protein
MMFGWQEAILLVMMVFLLGFIAGVWAGRLL